MKTFNLKPSKLVGEIKIKIREAILNGEIKNHKKEAKPQYINVQKRTTTHNIAVFFYFWWHPPGAF